LSDPTVISTSKLTKRYGEVVAIDSLDLDVECGTVYALLGPNGAGKTTTIKVLLGLVRPSSGRASVFGMDVLERPADIREHVGYVPESKAVYGYMTVAEFLRFHRLTARRWDSAAERDYIDLFELPLRRRTDELSLGMRTRLALAAALASSPDLLLLDEPTSGLDPVMRHEFLGTLARLVERNGITVLLCSHILSEVERVADYVGLLVSGRLRASRPMSEVRTTEKVVRVVFQRDPPEGLFDIEGVARVDRDGPAYLVTVSEGLGEFLKRIELVPRYALEVRDPGLERLFFEHAAGGREALGESRDPR